MDLSRFVSVEWISGSKTMVISRMRDVERENGMGTSDQIGGHK